MTADQTEAVSTSAELRKKGLNALIRELGVDGMVEFICLFEPRRGDYTQEREALLADITMEDVKRYLTVSECANPIQVI